MHFYGSAWRKNSSNYCAHDASDGLERDVMMCSDMQFPSSKSGRRAPTEVARQDSGRTFGCVHHDRAVLSYLRRYSGFQAGVDTPAIIIIPCNTK